MRIKASIIAQIFKLWLCSLLIFFFGTEVKRPRHCFISRRVITLRINPFLDFIEKEFAGWVRAQIRENPQLINIWGAHLQHSRELILEAGRYALAQKENNSPTRVLVIGAGNCLDIPLKELIQMFDEVYLLDLAYKTTAEIAERGIYYKLIRTSHGWKIEEERLDPEERAKLRFVLADASGGAALEIVQRAED
jgi:hypothetical protein